MQPPSCTAWLAVAALALPLAGCVETSLGNIPGEDPYKVSVFFVPDTSQGRTLSIAVEQDGATVGTWNVTFLEYTRLRDRNWEVAVAPRDALVRVREAGQPDVELAVKPQECKSGEAHVNVELDGDGPARLRPECTRVFAGVPAAAERAYLVTVFVDWDVAKDRTLTVEVVQGGKVVASEEVEAMGGFPFRHVGPTPSVQPGDAVVRVREAGRADVQETVDPGNCGSGEAKAEVFLRGDADAALQTGCN